MFTAIRRRGQENIRKLLERFSFIIGAAAQEISSDLDLNEGAGPP
jgi:hypothetical protein